MTIVLLLVVVVAIICFVVNFASERPLVVVRLEKPIIPRGPNSGGLNGLDQRMQYEKRLLRGERLGPPLYVIKDVGVVDGGGAKPPNKPPWQ